MWGKGGGNQSLLQLVLHLLGSLTYHGLHKCVLNSLNVLFLQRHILHAGQEWSSLLKRPLLRLLAFWEGQIEKNMVSQTPVVCW